jgi:hypothetical protein
MRSLLIRELRSKAAFRLRATRGWLADHEAVAYLLHHYTKSTTRRHLVSIFPIQLAFSSFAVPSHSIRNQPLEFQVFSALSNVLTV